MRYARDLVGSWRQRLESAPGERPQRGLSHGQRTQVSSGLRVLVSQGLGEIIASEASDYPGH